MKCRHDGTLIHIGDLYFICEKCKQLISKDLRDPSIKEVDKWQTVLNMPMDSNHKI